MVKIKLTCLIAFLVFGIGLLFTNNRFIPVALSFEDGPPPGHTEGPGEGTCAECHFDNPGPGIFTIIAPANYVPGQTYQLHVHHSTTDMTRLRWGFQMTALDNTNTFAGAFANTTTFTQMDFGNGRFYIEHTFTGTFAGTSGGADWSFDWTAPSTNVGSVTFYAAGNQANNDRTFDGDQIYSTSTVTSPVAESPTPTSTATNSPTPAETPSISGTVTYGNSNAGTKFISGVSIAVTPGPFTVGTPPGPGQYVLTDFGPSPFTVSLSKTTGQNGISSNDAAQVAQNVAGTVLITSNTKKIAADTSGNGSISSQDAAFIARFVAGLGPPIGQTNGWRFFVPSASFPTFPVGGSPTTRSYTPPIGNITGEDYIGILIGEVSGNWNPGTARKEGIRQKPIVDGPVKEIAVELPQVEGAIGKEIVVPVKVENVSNKDVISYEFDLKYDAAVIQPLPEPVEVKETVSRGLSIVTNVTEPGILRVVAYGAFPIDQDGILLNLRFGTVGVSGATSPMTIERILFDENESPVNVVEGQIVLQ